MKPGWLINSDTGESLLSIWKRLNEIGAILSDDSELKTVGAVH
jgi:hypothetical protein